MTLPSPCYVCARCVSCACGKTVDVFGCTSVGPPRNKDVVHVLLVQGSELWCITSICGRCRCSSAINTQHLVRAVNKQGTSRTAWVLPSAEVRTSPGRNSVADANPGMTNITCKKERAS